jgi:hypothetical protein
LIASGRVPKTNNSFTIVESCPRTMLPSAETHA